MHYARLSVLLVLSVAATAQPVAITKIATIEGVTEYRFANGLRVVLFPDVSSATISLNIVYLAGLWDDRYVGMSGTAHILEHLVSYGSSGHPDAKAESSDRGDQRGAQTSSYRTTYVHAFPATPDNLAWAIDLEADRMRNAILRSDILASQMTVVRNESAQSGDNLQFALWKRVVSVASSDANFFWGSHVENVPIEKVRAFYDYYYHPNNAVVVIAGKFEEAAALKLIAQKFGPIPRSSKPIPPVYTSEVAQDAERSLVWRGAGDIHALVAAYHIPGAGHPDFPAIRVLHDALTSQPNGRLYRALVPTQKAASVTTAMDGGPRGTRYSGLATFEIAIRKEGPLEDVRATVIRTLDNLANEPFTEQEVESSRSRLLSQIELRMNNSQAMANSLAEAAGWGDWRLLFWNRDRISSTTATDLARIAKAYPVPSNRTIGMLVSGEQPARPEIPQIPDLETLLKGYTGIQTLSVGEAFDPSPENIEKRIERGKLSSGLQYALLPKQTRGNTVNMTLALRFGDATSLAERRLPAQFAASLLMRGTARHTRQEIDDNLSRLKARLTITGSPNGVTAQIQTVRANVGEVLRLAAEVLRTPSFPAAEFEQSLQASLAGAEGSRRDPQLLATAAMRRHLIPYPPDDPRTFPLTPEERVAQLQKLTLDEVRGFHSEFYGASNGEIVLVGDFDAAALRPLLGELFGKWKSPKPYRDLAVDARPVTAIRKIIDVPEKGNAVFLAGAIVQVRETDQEFPALLLANQMMGVLDGRARLYLRIRAKDGLSYGVFSTLQISGRDSSAFFQGFAIAAPQNVPKVEVAFREEFERAARDGFSAEEVTKAKAGWLQSLRVQRSQDGTLAQALQSLLRDGRTMVWQSEFERKVEAVTPQQAMQAVRKYLQPSLLSIFAAGDFKKAGVFQ